MSEQEWVDREEMFTPTELELIEGVARLVATTSGALTSQRARERAYQDMARVLDSTDGDGTGC